MTSEAVGQQMSLPKAYKQNWDFLKHFWFPSLVLLLQNAFLFLPLLIIISSLKDIIVIGDFHVADLLPLFVEGVQKCLPELSLVWLMLPCTVENPGAPPNAGSITKSPASLNLTQQHHYMALQSTIQTQALSSWRVTVSKTISFKVKKKKQ